MKMKMVFNLCFVEKNPFVVLFYLFNFVRLMNVVCTCSDDNW